MNDQQRAASLDALKRANDGICPLSIAAGLGRNRIVDLLEGRSIPTAYEAQAIHIGTGGRVGRHEIRPDLYDPPKKALKTAKAMARDEGARKIVAAEMSELLIRRRAKRAPASTIPKPAEKVVNDGKARSRRQAEAAGGKEEGGKGEGRKAGRLRKGGAKR